MKIGITMIVSDRAEELERAIKSVDGFYDYLSICLVKYNKMTARSLTGKRYAKCREVAKKYNAIISEYKVREDWKYKFIDDFSTPRNMAIDALPDDTDWVFILDSDDEMQEPKVCRLLVEELEQPSMVLVSIGADVEKDMISTSPQRSRTKSLLQMRMWSKGIARYKGRIHEVPIYDSEKVGTVSVPEIVLIHKPNEHQKHNDRNVLLLDDVIKSGDYTARELFYYAETMYITANQRNKGWEKMEKGAVNLLEQLTLDPDLGAAIYKVYCYLADAAINAALTKKGDFDKAVEYIMTALQVSQLYPEPYYLMGKVLYLADRSTYSIGWFRQAVEMPHTISIWHSSKSFKRSLPAENLAFVYQELGDMERAIRYHTLARAMDKRLEINDERFGI